MRTPWLLAAALTAAPLAANADDVTAGRAVVDRLCAGCHAVAPGEAAPRADAPTFVEIAGRYPPDSLGEAFAEGALVGHPDMPAFELPPDEITAIVSYLESLRAGR